MEPNTAKMLGGIGSTLTFLTFIGLIIHLIAVTWTADMPIGYGSRDPYQQILADIMFPTFLWSLIALMGSILVLFGLYELSNYYNDDDMRRNSLWWFIWWAVLGTVVGSMALIPLLWAPSVAPSVLLIAGIVLFLAYVIIIVLSAIYLKKAYAALAARSGEGLFNTAASLYWWGSVLTILLVGEFLIWISWVISAAAFFSMKPRRPDAAAWTAPPPPG